MTLAEACAELGVLRLASSGAHLSEAHDRTAQDDGLCAGVRYTDAEGQRRHKVCSFPVGDLSIRCRDCQQEQASTNARTAAGENSSGWRAQP